MTHDLHRFFDFIVIDDSRLDLIIAQKMLKRMNAGFSVQTYDQAALALDFVKERNMPDGVLRTVLLVDVRMPLMDGFAFMEQFSQLPEELRRHYVPCMLTSSISEYDRTRAENMPVVHAFLNKPPDAAVLEALLIGYILDNALILPAS